MKPTLLLLLFPLLALATPAPAPAHVPGHNETETPGSARRYNALIGSDDPRTLDELIAEMGLNRSEIRYTFDNPAFKGFSATLPQLDFGQLSTTSGFVAFEADKKIQMAGEALAPWGLKRISQQGKVDVGKKDLKKPEFQNYVFDGPPEDLGKGVDIYMLDSGIK